MDHDTQITRELKTTTIGVVSEPDQYSEVFERKQNRWVSVVAQFCVKSVN